MFVLQLAVALQELQQAADDGEQVVLASHHPLGKGLPLLLTQAAEVAEQVTLPDSNFIGQWLLCGCCVCQWLLPKGRCFCSLLQSINYGRQAG